MRKAWCALRLLPLVIMKKAEVYSKSDTKFGYADGTKEIMMGLHSNS